jgi:hypothetical protein
VTSGDILPPSMLRYHFDDDLDDDPDDEDEDLDEDDESDDENDEDEDTETWQVSGLIRFR